MRGRRWRCTYVLGVLRASFITTALISKNVESKIKNPTNIDELAERRVCAVETDVPLLPGARRLWEGIAVSLIVRDRSSRRASFKRTAFDGASSGGGASECF